MTLFMMPYILPKYSDNCNVGEARQMGLVRKLIAITGAPRCWTGAMRNSQNSVKAKFTGIDHLAHSPAP